MEPFWSIYTIHKTKEVREILDSYLIGKLKKDELKGRANIMLDIPKPYANEPVRHPAFVINSLTPFDAETPPELLMDNDKTPNDIFFVRNHLPVPIISKEEYRLTIELPGDKHSELSFEDLKTRFNKRTIVATLQCAGNRRAEMSQHKKVYGAPGMHNLLIYNLVLVQYNVSKYVLHTRSCHYVLIDLI